MKVLLLKDVYKLGRAGDVKRVADGYGRNYLLPQKLAVLATAEALNSSNRIREKANIQRAIVNKEMDTIARRLEGVMLVFPARASETGKLYGSITTQMLVEALKQKTDVDVARRQMDTQPIRALGEYKVHVRLTVDLIPEVTVIVHREGEAVTLPGKQVEEPAPQETVVETPVVEAPVIETPVEAPVEASVEAPAETPAEPVAEAPAEPAEAPAEPAAEA